MKTRDHSLDLIRIVACLLVVLMHSPMPSDNASGPFLSALSYLTAPCIGLFFMVSGALLLPVKDDYCTFFRRRLSKIVIPTLAWTAIYLGLKIYYSKSEINIVRAVFSVPFSAQGHGILWFMYTLIGLYLLAPILSAWINVAKDREIRFVLLLWAVSLCYPLIEGYIQITTGTTGILYYFTGYAGYFLLGYYLKHRCQQQKWIFAALIAAVGFALIPTLKYMQIPFDFYRIFWYESIFVAALCCVIWSIIGKMKILVGGGYLQAISGLSNLTFGVYLAHILVMRYWLWHTEWIQDIINYPLQTITIFLLTTIITFIFALLTSRMPLLHHLMGYKR